MLLEYDREAHGVPCISWRVMVRSQRIWYGEFVSNTKNRQRPAAEIMGQAKEKA